MTRDVFPVMPLRAHINYPQVTEVPWEMVAPHAAQAKKNHGQTLDQLAERGGLDATELLAVLQGRRWKRMVVLDAIQEVEDLVRKFKIGNLDRDCDEPRKPSVHESYYASDTRMLAADFMTSLDLGAHKDPAEALAELLGGVRDAAVRGVKIGGL